MKVGQGQPNVIYINVVELESPILHAKFQDHRIWFWRKRRVLKVFIIYGHGGHLGHLTWTIYINFHSPFPTRLHIKFGFDWAGSFREEDVKGR